MPCEPKPEPEVEEVSEEEKTVDALLEGIDEAAETEDMTESNEETEADGTAEADQVAEIDGITEMNETVAADGIIETNQTTENEEIKKENNVEDIQEIISNASDSPIDSSEESETLGETIAMPVITEDTEEETSENFVPDAEKDETDVKSENSFRKIKICLSKIKSFLEEEDDEEEDEEDEEVSNECEVIPFKSKEDSDEK